jgi:hypothetical protein
MYVHDHADVPEIAPNTAKTKPILAKTQITSRKHAFRSELSGALVPVVFGTGTNG